MTFILTNDDGFDAPGIQALKAAVAKFEHPSVIVAPNQQYSGCSHQLTRDRPIKITKAQDGVYAIDGTPADCTRIAINHLCTGGSWILSGINAGGNLGADIYVSGTVAAVREAALSRRPAIAISHYIHNRRPIDWNKATQLVTRVLDKLLDEPAESGCFWNVNLPHLQPGDPEPELVLCNCCTLPLPTDFEVIDNYFHHTGAYGDRLHDPNSDVEVCFGGNIAITRHCLWTTEPVTQAK
jgi:5'-nucleotidase